MRIGFDCDGVLAGYNRAAAILLTNTSRRKLIPESFNDETSPTWYWPQHFGYTEAEVAAMWDVIKTSRDFWANLVPLQGMATLQSRWKAIHEAHHDIVFATARPGLDALTQTKYWLHKQGCSYANVTITSEKGQFCLDHHVDCYIDDRWSNIVDVTEKAPNTRAYLLNRNYNIDVHNPTAKYIRVPTVAAFFEAEGL